MTRAALIELVDLSLARGQYYGKAMSGRFQLAMRVTPDDPSPVRRAAREELEVLIEEWVGEDPPARLLARARNQIARLR